MIPTLYRSGRHVSEADVQALAEFLRATNGGERQLHRLLEAHPTIIGALGFLEFLSEYSLSRRDSGNRLLSDPRHRYRADILAARLSVTSDLQARKFANVIELKGANDRVLNKRTHRRSRLLNEAVSQLRDYTGWLTNVDENRKSLSEFGWDVWKPSKIVIMGSTSEFRDPGELEWLKQELLEDGVQLLLTDELLVQAEMERLRQIKSAEDTRPIESIVGFGNRSQYSAPLIVASGGLAGLILARRRLNDNLTPYGNVDIRNGVPNGLVHIPKLRLQPLARKLDIAFAEALVGFSKYRTLYKAEKLGIVVADYDSEAILQAFELREQRNRPLRERRYQRELSQAQPGVEEAHRGTLGFSQRVQARTRPAVVEAQQRTHRFSQGVKAMFPGLSDPVADRIARRATRPGSRRVGTDPTLQFEEAVWLAVAAHAAYEHLGLGSKAAADSSRDVVRQLLRKWGGPNPEEVMRGALGLNTT